MKKLDKEKFRILIDLLQKKNYTTIGPVVKNGVIVYDEFSNHDKLPLNKSDFQEPGVYSLNNGDNGFFFNYNVGPQSIKKYLYPPVNKIFTAQKTPRGIKIIPEETDIKQYAFIGLRSCELKALEILDNVFINGEVKNSLYKETREKALIVAVNCSKAGNNCFCTSTGTGPEVTNGYDILLTELKEKGKEPFFLAEAGSDKGRNILEELNLDDASPNHIKLKQNVIDNTKSEIKKKLNRENLTEAFMANFDSPVWDDIATKCMACANCTMVCPTCFCMTIEDYTDLKKKNAERIQKWDSCFTSEFSYIHGGSVRVSTKSRYRQWITHKLSNWEKQFGSIGCVGCGRCITWCPVGIDIVEEANRINNLYKNNFKGEKNGVS